MKIAGVVVTYNRKEELKKLIESVLNSTKPIDLIVVDNASNYDIESELKPYPTMQLLKMNANLGPAGGAEAGQKFAYEKGYDFVWMLDDDALVAPNALEELLKYYPLLKEKYGKVFLASIYVGALDFTKPFYNILRYNPKTGLTIKIDEKEFEKPYFEFDIAPMNGLFLPRELLSTCGFFDGRLWGWYDDTEFVLRARKAGFKGIAVPSSRIYHPIEYRKQVKILGRTFTLLSGRPFRMYLGTRNNIIVQKKFLKPLNFYFIFLPVFTIKRFISIVFFYENKSVFLKNFFRGIIDGLKGNLGGEK